MPAGLTGAVRCSGCRPGCDQDDGDDDVDVGVRNLIPDLRALVLTQVLLVLLVLRALTIQVLRVLQVLQV